MDNGEVIVGDISRKVKKDYTEGRIIKGYGDKPLIALVFDQTSILENNHELII